MPEFGRPNQAFSFPTWVTPEILNKLGWHPHPATPRIDGRLCWPSDGLHRSLATRQYGRLYWQETQPVVPNAPYANWENVWWDWQAIGPAEAIAKIGRTVSGRGALLRLKHYDSLPFSGTPGTEFYAEFFLDGSSIGVKTVEFEDQTHPFQYDTSVSEGGGFETVRVPPEPAPVSDGQWVKLTANPVSECWRFWDTQAVTACQHEVDPNGMAAIEVELSGWDWGPNEFKLGGGYTEKQLEFARRVNQKHVVRPVSDPLGQYFPCILQKQSDFVFDSKGVSPGGSSPLWYGYSIQVLFFNDSIRTLLHIRMWNQFIVLPYWEVITSLSVSSGTFIIFGIFGRMHSDQFAAAPPFDSRNISDEEITGQLVQRIPIGGSPADPKMAPADYSLNNVSDYTRGTEPPLEGPLDMPKKILDMLRHHDGATVNISSGSRMPLTGEVYDNGNWYDGGQATDRVFVPAGVSFIRGACNTRVSSGGGSLIMTIRRNGVTVIGSPYTREALGFNGWKSQNLVLPKIAVDEGDEIDCWVQNTGENLDPATQYNWLYLEAVTPQIEVISHPLLAHDEPIPAAATQIWGVRIPPILDRYTISHLSLSLGSQKSTSGPVVASFVWIRDVGRIVADITDDPVQIDEDEWTSDASAAPHSYLPGGNEAFAGDILVAVIEQPGLNATGLVVDLELTEPQ